MRRSIQRLLLGTALAAAVFLAAAPARAALSIADLQAQAQALLQQLQTLQQRVTKLQLDLTSDLQFGTRASAQVKQLQQFLIAQGYLPSGSDSGNFLSHTLAAVKKLQRDNGLPAVGRVGPLTRQLIARLSQQTGTTAAPAATSTAAGADTSPVQVPQPVPAPAVNSTSSESATTTSPALPQHPFRVDPKPAYDYTALAHAIQDAINQVRQQNGLGQLQWSDALATMAQLHSDDQAKDNIEITNPQLLCNYPLIRHEDFSIGFSLGDRLAHQGIGYTLAGENIAMVPLSNNLVYEYPADNPPPPCPVVPDFPPGEGTQQERTQLYQSVLAQSRGAVAALQPVAFVNKEWLTPEAAVNKIVNGWMNSPGHRANILEPEFTMAGIGITAVNDYIIVTHDFDHP